MEIRSSCFPPFRRISSRKANRDAGIIETLPTYLEYLRKASGSCPSTAVGYYRADDLPDVCNYSHGQAAVSSAPLTSEPDTTNLDTD